jgi:hypothetical protein
VPSADSCEEGGSSPLIVINPTTGAGMQTAVIDIDGNGTLNSSDKVTVSATKALYASGIMLSGVVPTPTVITAGSLAGAQATGGAVLLGTPGSLSAVTGLLNAYAIVKPFSSPPTSMLVGLKGASGRVSWREVLAR